LTPDAYLWLATLVDMVRYIESDRFTQMVVDSDGTEAA